MTCADCDGNGTSGDRKCLACGGTGNAASALPHQVDHLTGRKPGTRTYQPTGTAPPTDWPYSAPAGGATS